MYTSVTLYIWYRIDSWKVNYFINIKNWAYMHKMHIQGTRSYLCKCPHCSTRLPFLEHSGTHLTLNILISKTCCLGINQVCISATEKSFLMSFAIKQKVNTSFNMLSRHVILWSWYAWGRCLISAKFNWTKM